ncbi:Uma2 family endonuclease [Streptomyces sp. 900105755]
MTDRPTTSGAEPGSFEDLLDTLDELDVPDGYRAGTVKGTVVLSPWSKGYYTRVMRLVCGQLEAYLPEGHVIERAPNLFVFPGAERAYGPGVHAADERVFDSDGTHLDGEALSFVTELTSSSTRDGDLTDKVRVYGRARTTKNPAP